MPTHLWNQIRERLALAMDAQHYQTWVAPLRVADSQTEGTLTLQAPNQFMCDFLEQHYLAAIAEAARAGSSTVSRICFVPAPTAAPQLPDLGAPGPSLSVLSPTLRVAPLTQSTLNKRFTFDSFVVGSGNEFAKSAAFAVAESLGRTKFNPLLIYGGVGLGKTHLLQAIGNYALSVDPLAKVSYITSEEFYLSFIEAIKNNDTKTFTARFRACDALLVDDVQFLGGKESTQEEFFFIFNTLYQNAKQIVLTSDEPPASLRGLQDRLLSRFQWGLSVDIQPPNLETRVAILKKKAEEGRLDLAEDILYFLAESYSANIRELEGAIIRLLAYASITKCDLDLETVKGVLKTGPKKEKTRASLDHIIERVSEYYGIPVNNLREKNRRKEVAHARQVAMYIAKCITNHSLKSIGLNFGGRDHSTVIHAVSQIESLRRSDPELARQIDQIIADM
jgi:chromosomal replication initiator protein